MIINNELVNRLIREGESLPTISMLPKLTEIMDENGRFRQASPRVPLLDCIRAIIAAAGRLHPDRIHPIDLSGISALGETFESLILTLERIEPEQKDCVTPEAKTIKREVKDALGAHAYAKKTSDSIAMDPKFNMQKFVDLINKSPNPQLTKDLLAEAGPNHGGWSSSDGPLAPLHATIPATLPSARPLELKGTISNVDESNGTASFEVCDYRNDQAKALLEHHPAKIDLHFDKDGIEREDLLVIQYRREAVWLKVSAICATHEKHAKKTSLALSEVRVNRKALNSFHEMFRQTRFDFASDSIE